MSSWAPWEWFDFLKKQNSRAKGLAVAEGWIAVSIAFREIGFLLFYRWYFRSSWERLFGKVYRYTYD